MYKYKMNPITGKMNFIGGGGVDVLYSDLVTAINSSKLVPGTFYRITDFATRHFLVDNYGDKGINKIYAPGPTDFTLTTDVVGEGAVTNYGRLFFFDGLKPGERSLPSDEFEFQTSEETTSVILDIQNPPAFAQTVFMFWGSQPGVYSYVTSFSVLQLPLDIWNASINEADYDGYLSTYAAKRIGSEFAINVGETEPLTVLAISANTIDKEARSSLFPQDIIHYDWNPDNWLSDPSFADIQEETTIVEGFKGVINFRHDTLLDNYMGYDFRNCRFRRWKVVLDEWVAGSYEKYAHVRYNEYGYVSVVPDNNQTPGIDSSWVKILDFGITEYWSSSIRAPHFPIDEESYIDFKTFVDVENSAYGQYEGSCMNNHFEPTTKNIFNQTILGNNVFFLTTTDSRQICENEIRSHFFGNTIVGTFLENNIGTNFHSNILGVGFSRNEIDGYFYENTIYTVFAGNKIASGFNYNEISSFFTNNFILHSFGSNLVCSHFSDNRIHGAFQENFVFDYFRRNTGTAYEFEFGAASKVYGNYSCELFKREDGTTKLKYVDNTDTIVIEDINPE